MQNYRERLTPSLWAFGAATVLAPMGALVLAPFDSTIGLIAGTALALLVILAMASFATTISVQGTILRDRKSVV